VLHFQTHRSVPKLILHTFFKGGLSYVAERACPLRKTLARAGMTDDVVEGKVSESQFRKAIVWLIGGRLAGTLLAQVLLVPAALIIAAVARLI
jgi:hypothetical protein